MADAQTASTAPELTLRSVLVGLVVALIIGSAYPYCVLKLGFGPNLSVVSAFFGFIALVLILRAAGTNARENNIVQTMGTSAGQHFANLPLAVQRQSVGHSAGGADASSLHR